MAAFLTQWLCLSGQPCAPADLTSQHNLLRLDRGGWLATTGLQSAPGQYSIPRIWADATRRDSGYDHLQDASGWIEGTGTSDPGGGVQKFWAPGCKRGGWLFFPSVLSPGQGGAAIARLTIQQSCDAKTQYGSAFTQWLYQADALDLGLGALPTVWSMHYDAEDPWRADLAGVSLERFAFQFTQGPVLWQAWATEARCAERALSCGPERERWQLGGKVFVKVDERIWSRPVALPVPMNGAALKLMAGDTE